MTFDRARALERLANEHFDVLVIGGGITGTGVALDAASRGLRTALIERHDFASGTSSKSSKLVHGGLRYLQQKEVGLVYENLAERQIALRNAPHLVRVLPFLLPIFAKDGLINRRLARALGLAMWAYDLTGGLRVGKRHQRITSDEAIAHMPSLEVKNLASAYIYYDAHADDARLTLTVARTAADRFDAVCANYVSAVGVVKDGECVRGARVEADGREFEISARAVVNAAGVWVDDVRAFDEGKDPQSIRPAKGIHITVPWAKVRNDIAAVIPVAKDRRSIFVVKWGDLSYVGTTDTDYDGPIDDPQCTHDDVTYLLDAMNAVLTEPLLDSDVLGTWAGLRPLFRETNRERTADLSRRHKVRVAESGLITIMGGKLTTYRKMAADTVDVVSRQLGQRTKTRTKHLALLGAADWNTASTGAPEHLAGRYGSLAPEIIAIVTADPSLGTPLVPGLPYLRAEAVYAVRHEMARTVDDVLARRTRARLLARDASAAAADNVAAIIGGELGWSTAEREQQASTYRASVAHERDAARLPETALDSSLGA